MNKKTLFKIILAVSAVFVMTAIFMLSAQTGEKSSEASRSVSSGIGTVVENDYKNKTEDEKKEYTDKLDEPVRKLAHVAEFTVLAVVLFANSAVWGIKPPWLYIVPFAASVVYAASDEVHQLFVPGRHGAFTDVLIDCIGITAGCAVSVAVHFLRKRHLSKKQPGDVLP